jgi:SAM-dependent methyltransferase
MERQRVQGTAGKQAALWGRRARDWAELQEGQVRPLYDSVLDAFDVGRGTQVLDVGCGAGLFLRLAADRGASVAGLDATAELLEIARERTPAAELNRGELEELPFESERFDLVTGFNSFQFAAQPVNALREAARVVHEGGAIVMAVWGTPEQCEAAAILSALSALMPTPPPGAPGPFALSAPGALGELVRQAGLTSVRAVDVSCPWSYPSLADAVRAQSSAGPAALARDHSGEEAVVAALGQAFAPFEQPGGYRLENVFRYVIATP